jgi:hypothetical protein
MREIPAKRAFRTTPPAFEIRDLLVGHPLAMPFPVVGELKVGAIRGKLGERKRAALDADSATCV